MGGDSSGRECARVLDEFASQRAASIVVSGSVTRTVSSFFIASSGRGRRQAAEPYEGSSSNKSGKS